MSRWRLLCGVWLISLCVLMLELALTRLFSATMYYHFAFLAVSLALFGSGASGVLVYLLRPVLAAIHPARLLFVAATLFSVATIVALWVVLRNPLPLSTDVRVWTALIRIYAATSLPFFFAGCMITLAVSEIPHHMSTLYMFDLTGAAAGCLLLIPALDWIGATNTVVLVSVLASLAGLLFGVSCGNRRYAAASVLVTTGLLVLFSMNLRDGWFSIARAKGRGQNSVIYAKWNSFSRVTVEGDLRNDSVQILIDADAASEILRGAGDLSRHAETRQHISALAYHLRPEASVLVIGPGGGSDVVAARQHHSSRVTAVEVNPIIAVDVMSSEPFKSYSGWIYEQPGVGLHVEEGRSFIRRSSEKYDVIQATLVDTWAATGAGAFALTENYLYTVEAFKDFLAHLTDDGILTMTRWYFDPPDQMLRLVAISRQALAELGCRQPRRHVMVWAAPGRPQDHVLASLMVKRTPFTDREIDALDEVSAINHFRALYTPDSRGDDLFRNLMEAADPESVCDTFVTDIKPSRDNHPFYFNSLRLADLSRVGLRITEWHKTNLGTVVLFALVLISSGAVILFVLGPLAIMRHGSFTGQTRQKLTWVLYFACLGVGFIVVEVILIQKFILFLGRPVYSLTVVLFSLLLFSGLGSWLCGRVPEDRLGIKLRQILLGLAALVVLASFVYSPIFYELMHLPPVGRIFVSVGLLAPVSLLMGMPMPIGIRIMAERFPHVVPWAWGVNGAASVLGSVGALALALMTGFDQALAFGATVYLVACLLAVR